MAASLVGLGLPHRLGKEIRAVADNIALAEVTGIDRAGQSACLAVAGGLAALAGILYAASIGTINPNFGFPILLSLFAAAVLGGIGNAYGALAGGIVGLAQEWSTLFFNTRWKPAIGFAILILTLFLMPRGIFGREGALVSFRRDFWLGVGVTAGVYGIFVLGLQINVGFTGLLNLGQAGFMAIGAYAMGMLVVDAGWSLRGSARCRLDRDRAGPWWASPRCACDRTILPSRPSPSPKSSATRSRTRHLPEAMRA